VLLRLLLRSVSLAAKFGLTIAIARALGFAAVGEYGLAVAVSVIASKLLGLGFSAELNRRMSGTQPAPAIDTARALRMLYASFYVIACASLLVAARCGWFPVASASPHLGLVLVVAASEHYALEANTYAFSVHRMRPGSAMLFLRTGGWAAVAIAGLLGGVIADMRLVFLLWILANAGVIVWAWTLLGNIKPHVTHDADNIGRVTARLWETWKTGAPVYIGGVLLSGLQYAERFVASTSLPAAELGRYVFAWSVANSVQTIAYATVGVIAGPRLARAAGGSTDEWRRVFRQSLGRTLAIGVVAALAMAFGSPLIFSLAHEAISRTSLGMFAVLLLSFVLRSAGDILWAASVSLKARWGLMAAMCAAASAALPFSLWIIPGRSAIQVALAHLLASVAVLAALAWMISYLSRREKANV